MKKPIYKVIHAGDIYRCIEQLNDLNDKVQKNKFKIQADPPASYWEAVFFVPEENRLVIKR